MGLLDWFGGTQPAAPYEAAGGSGRRSRIWRVLGFGPNTAITYALEELRRKSRDQARKNPYAASAVAGIVSNTIGTGIKPQSQAARPTEGLSPEEVEHITKEDAAFRRAVQQLWLDWTDEADAVGSLDFYGLQSLAMRGMVEGGETFVRMRTRRPEDGLLVPLQLQALEGDHCPHIKNEPGKRIRQGIQFDEIGRRTGYHLYREHPGDGAGFMGDFETSLVPAADVCHLYRPLRPGQHRGEPWLAQVLRTLYDLDAYLDAELVRKKNAALFLGFIKRIIQDGEDDSGIGTSDPDAEGTAELAMEPGTLQALSDGEDIEFSNPPDTGQNFEPFLRQQLRGVAVGAGLLYEVLAGDYGTLNDRVLRAALNDFRRRVEGWQHQLVVYQLCRPVYARWFDLALLSGALTLPSGMTRRQALRAEWIPQAWPYIHPVQDVQSKTQEIQAGLSSRSKKVSESGYDAEEIDAENAADNDRADRLDLSYTSDGRTAVKAPKAVPAADDDQPGQQQEQP